MSVKIINVLKDDSFNDILDIFRQSSAAEVILVLPRVGRLFRHEDHFAAFAAEAQQGGKTVSVLTSNPQTALLARKFGFAVMASGLGKSRTPAASAELARAPMQGDVDIPDFNDTADLGDVPLTSDETQGTEPEDTAEADPLHGMHVEDADGKVVDENEDGKADEPNEDALTVGDDAGFVSAGVHAPFATFAAAPSPKIPSRPPQDNDIDGVRIGAPRKAVIPVAKTEKPAPVPVQRAVPSEVDVARAETDYIDAVWRDKNGKGTTEDILVPQQPSFFSRTLSGTAKITSGTSMPKRFALGILAAAVVVFVAVIYLMTGSARVVITPVSKTVDTQITVQASDVFTSVDDAFAKIPGQIIDISKTAENTVPATGTRDVASKSRGKITVFNEYSSTPQTLVATTRFASDGGKVFRTLQTITVPGSTQSAGQTVPGKITVDVIADAPGPDYNVPAGRFIILSFKEKGDTEKVEKFYGKSDAPMSGGASGPSSVVTQADYDKARDAAVAAVKSQVIAALDSQGADLNVLDADKPVISNTTSTANPDDAAESVTVKATGTIKTVAFRKQDLMDLIARTILKKDRLVVLPEQLQLSYTDIAFKSDLGTLVFTVTIKGTGYVPVDTDAIARDIAGKNAQNIRDYFKGREGVESASVTLSPFWVRRVPQNTAKIDIELLYGTTP